MRDEWRRMQLDEVVEVNPEALGADTPIDYRFRYLDIASVEKGRIDWSSVTDQVYRSAPSRARRVVRYGDSILCTVRPSLQAHTYADWTNGEDIICSTGFAVLRPRDGSDPDFLRHLLFSQEVASHLRRRESGSSYPAVTEIDVEAFETLWPPLPEQRRIARVLDTVDAAIRQTEAVIAKLKQVKAGLLHDLLTRGLDENGELRDPVRHPEQFKDSPLGRVPREWEVASMADVADQTVGPAFASSRFTDNADHVRLLRGVNITTGTLRWNDAITMRWPELSSGIDRYLMREGDVVIGMDGALVGQNYAAVSRADLPSLLVQRVCRLRALDRMLQRLIYYQIEHPNFRLHVDRRKTHTAIPHISGGDISEYSLVCPPLQEQAHIVRILDETGEAIVSAGHRAEKLISLKQGLMQDFLTGRVRVPEEAVEGVAA